VKGTFKATRTHGRWEPHDDLFRTTTRADEAARKLLLSSTVVVTHAALAGEPWKVLKLKSSQYGINDMRPLHTDVKRVAFATARAARMHSYSSNFVCARVGSLGLVEECGDLTVWRCPPTNKRVMCLSFFVHDGVF
jgi:hypothetical protein